MKYDGKIKIRYGANKYLFFSAVIYILFALIPFVRVLPALIKAAIIVVTYFLMLMGSVNAGKRNVTRSFFIISVLALILDLFIYIGEYQFVESFSFISKYPMMFAFWCPFLIGAMYVYGGDYDAIKRLKKVIIFALMLTAITTIIGLNLFEDASRQLASGDTDTNRYYQGYNIGGYGFIYALTLSIPWAIYKISVKKQKGYIAIMLFMIACIIKSNYTTALIMMVYGVVMGIVMVKTTRKGGKVKIMMLSFLVIIIAVLVINSNAFWSAILDIVKDNELVSLRIANLRDLFLNQTMTGDVGFRNNLYNMSVESFFASPLMGNVLSNNIHELGYHSEIIDLLGGCGLLGLIILMVLVTHIYSIYKPIYRKNKLTAFMAIMIMELIVFSFINTIIGSLELSVIVGLLYLPEEATEHKE